MYGSGFEVLDENSKARARLNINKDGADFTLDDGNDNQGLSVWGQGWRSGPQSGVLPVVEQQGTG